MKPAIHDRGRGPEIVGSRITVYDVLAETRAGVPIEQLAQEWNLTVEQIEFALRYIDVHREEVERNWAAIQERNKRESEEFHKMNADRLAASREKLLKAKAEFDRKRAGGPGDEGSTGGHEHPGTNGECSLGIRRTGMA